MKIAEIILSRMRACLQEHRLLVVYDESGRLLPLAEELAREQKALFFDTSIRLTTALKATEMSLQEGLKTAVVLTAHRKIPESDEEKREDPLAAFAEIGAAFPEKPSDSYKEICLQALPKKSAAVLELFSRGEPDFSLIEPLFAEGPASWPILQGLSGKKSEEGILGWLLTQATEDAYRQGLPEIQKFAKVILGRDLPTEQSTDQLKQDLWCSALMTEFMTARGNNAPDAFSNLSLPPEDSRKLVCDVVNALRNTRHVQSIYEEYARHTADNLDIGSTVGDITLEQTRCTFPQEAQALKHKVCRILSAGVTGDIEQYLTCLSDSFWTDDCDVFVAAAKASLEFGRSMDSLETSLKANCAPTLKNIINTYSNTGSECDRAAREFSEAVLHLQTEDDDAVCSETAEKLQFKLFDRYRSIRQKEHTQFIQALKAEGWPASDVAGNQSVFKVKIDPLLKHGRRVAFIIVDALRYELGVLLAKNLENFSPVISAACAALPTITVVGKASLLPNGELLQITTDYGEKTLTVKIDGTPLKSVKDRMHLFEKRFGDRFKHITLADLIRRPKQMEGADLLCVRYDDIDTLLETEGAVLQETIQNSISKLTTAVTKIAKSGHFSDIVIATDHGFGLNLALTESDKCSKPAGTWVATHERFLLGEGASDAHNCVLPAAQLGIQTNVPQAAFPMALCAYATGKSYFHGGVSLQEAVVPVITIQLGQQSNSSKAANGIPQLELIPKKPRQTTLIARIILKVINPGLSNLPISERRISIQITEKGAKEPVGHVLDNTADTLTVTGEDIEFRIRLNDNGESKRTIEVSAVDAETEKKLARTSLEVELTQ